MEVKINTEDSKVKGLNLEVSCAEWLVINKALKMLRMNLNNKDAVIADDLIDTVLTELKETAWMPLPDGPEKRCAVCVETGTKWCSDCTENGGRYNYFKVR